MASDLKTSNPIKIMGIVMIVLLIVIICIQLFVKTKVQMSDGTSGRVGVFGNLEPDYGSTAALPQPTSMEQPV